MANDPPLTSFNLFPQLPVELRLRIWRHSLPVPRKVRVYPNANALATSHIATSWASREVVPTVLHICRESRAEGLLHYQLTFGSNNQTPQVYFNYAKDCLVLRDRRPHPMRGSTYTLPLFLSCGDGATDAHKVQHLQLQLPNVRQFPPNDVEYVWGDIRRMAGLKHLDLGVKADAIQIYMVVGENCEDSIRVTKERHPEWNVPHIIVQSEWEAGYIIWEYPETRMTLPEPECSGVVA